MLRLTEGVCAYVCVGMGMEGKKEEGSAAKDACYS